MHNFSWKTSFFIILVCTVIIVICLNKAPSPYQAYNPQTTVGNVFTLKIPNTKLVLLGVTKNDLDEARKLTLAHDTQGLAKLAVEYRIILLDHDTQVRVIEKGFEITRLRILDGPYVTMDGWTYNSFLK